jgi:uncharacterized protein YbcI
VASRSEGMTSHQGESLAAVSRSIGSLHRRYYGKGPTESKSYLLDDAVLCILRGGFTTVEETLIADGKAREVEAMRRSFQRTMRARFVEVVESELEREVIGYMTQIHTHPDVAIEIFLLAPQE